MRPQKVLDPDLLKGLTQVFRAKGYAGTNLSELAEVINLKKASLYHRFPGGKQEMASTVLTHIEKWTDTYIFGELRNQEVPAQARLKNALAVIHSSYSGGEDSCIFRSLSLDSGIKLFQQQIAGNMQQWIDAFENFGLSIGLEQPEAYAQSVQTLVDIQGSLIVSKGMNSTTFFEQALRQIEQRYFKQ